MLRAISPMQRVVHRALHGKTEHKCKFPEEASINHPLIPYSCKVAFVSLMQWQNAARESQNVLGETQPFE